MKINVSQELRCACGLPLHYTDSDKEATIKDLNAKFGDYVSVPYEGKTYQVQRHYIALHGIKNKNPEELGFHKRPNIDTMIRSQA